MNCTLRWINTFSNVFENFLLFGFSGCIIILCTAMLMIQNEMVKCFVSLIFNCDLFLNHHSLSVYSHMIQLIRWCYGCRFFLDVLYLLRRLLDVKLGTEALRNWMKSDMNSNNGIGYRFQSKSKEFYQQS